MSLKKIKSERTSLLKIRIKNLDIFLEKFTNEGNLRYDCGRKYQQTLQKVTFEGNI